MTMAGDRDVAFITGAGSGMGQLCARRLLQQGWSVAAVDIDTAGLDQLGTSPQLLKLVCDVRDAGAVRDAVTQAEARLGPLRRVVNAAAIMPLGRLVDMDAATVRRLFDINVGGLVNVAAATMPLLIARRRGEFVSFASLSGHVPIFFMGAYAATKSAAVTYTEVLHQECRGSGVQVVCVCPPAVKTPLLAQGRATRWPRFLDLLPPITAPQVIDAVDAALRRRRFWVFPGWYTRASVWARRLCPGLLWALVRLLERPDRRTAPTRF
ncbi:MAG: SDR family NAD(P)-dependent oxidoreductase [Sinimarinibacterium flocculans]|uniref:SDR family NAD(P)-dependent oxidoreductase n=1 Tax=Sinimarinibacterium flocculans TaxID=985250 RepID=UPI003C44B278